MRTVRRFHIQENGVLYPSENGMVCYYMDVERIEAKCVELESKCAELWEAAEGIVSRWDSPLWKDQPHTGVFIDRLRAAIAKTKGEQP